MLGLERGTPRFGLFQLRCALVQLLVEQRHRFVDLAACTGDILVVKRLQQLVDHVLRQLRILAVAEVGVAHLRGDLEEAFLLALDLHVLGQAADRAFHAARGGYALAKPGRFNHPAKRRGARQTLANLRDVGLVATRNADLLGQQIVELHEDLRVAVSYTHLTLPTIYSV